MKRPALAASLLAIAVTALASQVGQADVFFRANEHVFGHGAAPLPEGSDEGDGDDGSNPSPPSGGGQNEVSPVRLAFPNATGVRLGSTVLSEPSLATGPADGFRLVATGGDIRVCLSYDCSDGGSFSTAADAMPGTYVQARQTGPAAPGATATMRVASGSFSTSFHAVGSDDDAGLTALAAVEGAEPGATVVSGLSGLYGYARAQLSVAGGEQQACGQAGCGPWTSGTVTLGEGDSVRLRTAAGRFGETRRVRATIAGGASVAFSVATRTIDQAPDAFGFSPSSVAGVEPFVAALSPVVRPAGFDQADVSVENGEYRICSVADCSDDAPWQSGTTLDVLPGHWMQVRVVPAFYGDSTAATLRVGSVEATFAAIARSQDTMPDDFAVAGVGGAEPGATVVSGYVMPTGFEGTVPLVASGGEVSSDDGRTWGASKVVSTGGAFRVRLTAGSFSETRTAQVRVGSGRPVPFTVATRPQDTLPDAFSIPGVADVDPGVLVVSQAVTPTGFEGSVPVVAANGEVSVDGGSTWAASRSLAVGGAFRIRVSSAPFGRAATATVGVGSGEPVPFVATTRAKDTTPDDFGFPPAAGVEPFVPSVSDAVRPTGFDLADASASGGEFQVCGSASCSDGSAWGSVPLADVPAGSWIRVRTTPSGYGATAVVRLTLGGASADFAATARPQRSQGSFVVPPATDAEPGVLVSSQDVTPTGIEGTVTVAAAGGEVSTDGGSTWAASRQLTAGASFRARVRSASFGGTASARITVGTGSPVSFTVSTRMRDETPDDFSFAAAGDVEPFVPAVSAAVRPVGFDAATVTVSGGEYQICAAADCAQGSAWTAGATASVAAGSWIRVRTAAPSYGETKVATLAVGGASAAFSATARPQDTRPDAFAVPSVANAEPGAVVRSAAVAPGGFEGTVTVAATGGEISVDDGSSWAASRSLTAGGAFRVRLTAASYGGTASAQVTVGTGDPVAFVVTTRDRDTTPDAFAMAAVGGADPSTATSSASVTPTGYEGTVTVSASLGEVSTDGGATWAASRSLTAGGSFRVRVTSGAYGQTVSSQVTVGSGTAVPFQVTTRAKDTTPDAFSFAVAANLEPGSQGVSAIVRPTGYDAADVGVSGGEYQVCAQLDCSDQTGWRTAVTTDLPVGYSMRVRTPALGYADSRTATLTVGGTSAGFAASSRAQDTTPDAFTVAAVGGANPSTATSSASVTPVGYEGTVSLSASNGQVSIDGGTTWATSASLTAGGSFRIRVTSSSSYGGTATASVTVGTGAPTSFTVTTRSQDTTPDAFTIAAVGSANPSTVTTSAAVTPTGYEGTVTVSVTGGTSSQVSTNGGSSWATSASLTAGGSFLVRTTSSASYATASTANVTVGSGAATAFTVTTRAQDVTPDAFPFADTANAAPGYVTSAVVTPTGFDGTVGVQPSGGTGTQVSVAGGAWTSSYTYITLGQTLQLRQNIAGYATTSTSTVSVGATTQTWKVTTRAQDTTPDAFTVAAATGAELSTVIASTAVTPTGYEGTVTVAATGGQVSVDGGTTWAASASLTAGGSFRVRATSSASYATTVNATVTVGTGTATTYAVTTRAQDTTPDAFAVADVVKAEPSTLTVSSATKPTGYEGTVTVTATDGEVSTDAGSTWGTAKLLTAGGSFLVRTTSSSEYGATVAASVQVGSGAATTFSVRTRVDLQLEPRALTATVGKAFSYDFKGLATVSGGSTADLTWTSSDKPGWMTISSAGVGSGTPTAAATASFNVTATHPETAKQQAYSIVVGDTWLEATRLFGGGYHSCALTTADEVVCWGGGVQGQLGSGSTNQSKPVVVPGLSASTIAQISTGFDHTCAVTTSGGLKCWGGGTSGQLGNNGSANTTTIQTIYSSGIASVSTGNKTTCAVTTSGAALCWGDNSNGQVGNGSTTTVFRTPQGVTGLGSGVASISAGNGHTCALTTGGAVKCWGADGFGQLGDGRTGVTVQTTPVQVSGLTSGMTQVTTGYLFSCARTQAGGAKCWGYGSDGQLGYGGTGTMSTPVDVSGFGTTISAISAGYSHACAVTAAGGVKCWGDGASGMIGDGSSTDRPNPVDVYALTKGVVDLGTGYYHTCVLLNTKGAKCWSVNGRGQVGDGTTTQRFTPVDVKR